MATQYAQPPTLAQRLREVRRALYGERGGPLLARALHLPAHAWLSYEAGADIPGRVLLRFTDISGVDLLWLLTGEGKPFPRQGRSGVGPVSVALSGPRRRRSEARTQ